MSRAAKHGVIVKSGSALERLAAANTFAFDKTGTITTGQPEVSAVQVIGKSAKKNEILAIAAALESHSNHVLAQTIVTYAEGKKVELAKVTQIKEKSGYGLSGIWQKQTVSIGKLGYMELLGVDIPGNTGKNGHTGTTSYIAIGNQLVGAIHLEDAIRPESKQMIKDLLNMGVAKTVMLTGDNERVARSVKSKVGISDYFANCLPQDKVQRVQELKQKAGPVAMVGDGVNDAPVLAAADVGIALGARGSTAASESADVVIMLDDVSKVAESVEIAKRTLYIGKQSIFIGIGISVGLMAVFATGAFKPVLGAALQEVVDVVVILNALRAHGSFK
jgi:P-type E1-E2 ATPase